MVIYRVYKYSITYIGMVIGMVIWLYIHICIYKYIYIPSHQPWLSSHQPWLSSHQPWLSSHQPWCSSPAPEALDTVSRISCARGVCCSARDEEAKTCDSVDVDFDAGTGKHGWISKDFLGSSWDFLGFHGILMDFKGFKGFHGI